MFLSSDFQKIDPTRYKIIRQSEHDFELQSLLTGHYWLFRSYDNFVMLFHKYKKGHTYHKQTNPMNTFNIALKLVIRHDGSIASNK